MAKTLKLLFQAALHLNVALTRNPRLRPIESHLLTPFFVRLTQRIRGRPPAPLAATPEALGGEWERLLGDRRYARVTEIDHERQTVYGEITGRCPLRGTGDLAACQRLMAYDRGLMAPHGARLVVLASQAEPGRSSCRIAMRPAAHDASDLVPAYRPAAKALPQLES